MTKERLPLVGCLQWLHVLGRGKWDTFLIGFTSLGVAYEACFSLADLLPWFFYRERHLPAAPAASLGKAMLVFWSAWPELRAPGDVDGSCWATFRVAVPSLYSLGSFFSNSILKTQRLQSATCPGPRSDHHVSISPNHFLIPYMWTDNLNLCPQIQFVLVW